MSQKINNWKKIWAQKDADVNILQSRDTKRVFLELKRCCGFDVVGGGLTYEAFLKQYRWTKACLFGTDAVKGGGSVYEVGCGSGANLFLFEQDGLACGGIDYSLKLSECAKRVLKSQDIVCAEAAELPLEPQYDTVLSNSVFSYFTDEEYAAAVLERMCRKARYSVGLIDLHDDAKKDDFLAYRRAAVEDYEERYKDLPKLFYKKQFFSDFARAHGMEIQFPEFDMDGYWNNAFIFHCFLYKR